MLVREHHDKKTNKFCRYLGIEYPIILIEDTTLEKDYVEFNLNSFSYYFNSTKNHNIIKCLQKFYKKECRNIINERLKIYQAQIRLKYRSVTIKESSAIWGSCNIDKHLVFNWKLIMLPIEVIDYVVVHELCHLKHLNHDRSFWRLVGRYYPNYKDIMKILGTDKKKSL
ncbi:M48 family metallopeptidase [Clostridium sp. 'deep sea']|uniref:M48 family metallopeptidase n=1 Tax=Clostridium sp. 'deep sea' TaxID=2779445 RepID=UPI001896980A|nr:SprT family zinc-dependent metalloprotease [Clostridium sp. 'deep sea']QOR34917.1 M48 family metallopeptidase [Clostridium sp. 'deep sea']